MRSEYAADLESIKAETNASRYIPMNEHKRRFGIKHSLPFFPNAGVFTKKFSVEAAAKADELANSIGRIATLAIMFAPGKVTVDGPTSVTIAGFKLFYEVAK